MTDDNLPAPLVRGRSVGRPPRRIQWLAAFVAAVALAGCNSSTDTADSPPARTSSDAQSSDASSSSPATDTDTAPPTELPTSGGATSTEPSTPATTPGGKPRTVTMVMNGDMLLHEGLWATAQIDADRTGRGAMDFRPLLADMRPVLKSADLAICHLETPLAPRGGPYLGYPVFAAPPQIVPALDWAGYDACTTASNHSLDQGFDGLRRTLSVLKGAGIDYAGTATTQKAAQTPVVLDVAGVKVGLISETYGTNGIPLPSEQPWSVPIINTDRIERRAAAAKRSGADVVLVALHWGLEYQHQPVAEQVDVAERLTKSDDIDFIYGHHAHVVQPYDRVNGTWVVYGLGNAVAQQDTAVEGVYDGNTCRVTFVERPDGTFEVDKLEYIPTMITPFDGVHPMRYLNVPDALRDGSHAAIRPQLSATRQRVSDVVNSLGASKRGVVQGR